MISLLKQEVRTPVSLPLLVLVFIYVLFAITERQVSPDSYEVFALRMLTEHYLLIYCMTPIFLLTMFRNLEEDSPFILIRHRNFSRYFYTKWLGIFIYSILFVLLQVIIVLVMGIGLPLNNAFPANNPAENELIFYFAAAFSTPLSAVMSSSIYMIVGLAFVGITILTIFHFFSRKAVTFMIVLAYGWMALSIKLPGLGALPFPMLNRYIILHHNFTVNHGVLWSVITMTVLVIIQILLIRFAWYRNFTISWKIKIRGLFIFYARAFWTKKNIIVLVGILGMLSIWKSMSGAEESVQDYMIRFFYGAEVGSYHFITFLEQLIYYGTPLYLFALFLEKWCTNDNQHVHIRMKQQKKWMFSIVGNGIVVQISYVSLTFGVLVLLGLLTNKSWMTHTIPIAGNIDTSIWPIIIGLKILEFTVLFLLLFLLFIWLKNVTAAFLIVMGMHAVNLIAMNLFHYNPAGLITIARLQLLEASTGIPLSHAFILLASMFIILLGLIKFSYKRYFD